MDDVAAAAARASATTAPTSFTSSASRRGAPRRSRPDSGGAESRPRLLAPGGWFSEVHVGWHGRRGGGPVLLLGLSATIASVVTSRPATDAACCSAVRTTLVGSL